MGMNTEKNSYTVLFAIGMVAVVGSLLAFVAGSLKPNIEENERLEKQQNILYAMGINENGEDAGGVNFISTDKVSDEFSKFIKQQLVIQGDDVTEDDQAYLIDIKKEEALAKADDYERRLPLFIGEKDGSTFYIVPMRGKGLWDAIWGYIALNDEMVVQGAYFDHAGETPGLGANIKERFFMDDFIGEHVYDGTAFKGIEVAKGNADPLNKDKTDNEVDAIAGATITGNGVAAMIKKDLRMYLPYFNSLKK
ncbi:Na(+)-translocating NADH-quinone reductase subunit C [Leptobacterium flavescens]|uniref:Na(+)-translocating NADH-quinone reductase subunit C n=1 Tax=Leptobacterium flavescens TaxID=472055 RepID=A0A6P0UN37_9FLAO|nr:Na(+)-translocating NADH-quinone reductase subunit C [Leptobacterium flavescens]NER12423.1 Na(+)-translocating NADH-quinone reductase subunit C [Leptobacterium flavescens]